MPNDDDDVFKLRWITIDKKTDVVALTAFILALFAAVFQVKDWLQGSDIEFYSPDRVVMYSYRQSNGIPIVRIAAPMSYTNTASSQYPSAVKSEEVIMRVGALKSKQEWISFGRLARDDTGFNPQIISDSSPVSIPGGSAISHSTLFGPFEVDCSAPGAGKDCRQNDNYISLGAMTAAVGAADELRFEFSADIFGLNTLSKTCSVKVTQAVIEQWSENYWLIAPCKQVSVPSLWSKVWKSL